MAETTIGRTFDELTAKVKEFDNAAKESQKEIAELNKGLKLSGGNSVDLVKQKYVAFEAQLDNTKQKADFLRQQIASLNDKKAQGIPLTDQEIAQLERLNQLLASTERQTTALTAAVNQKNKAIAKVQYGDMTKGLHDMQMMMSSTTTIMGLMGATGDTTGDKVMQGMQKAMSGMQAVIGMSMLLQKTNLATASTFQKVMISATLAMGTFALGTTIINSFGENARTVAKIVTAVGAAAVVAAVGIAIFKGTISRALGALAVAGAAAAAAGIVALAKSTNKDIASSASSAATIPASAASSSNVASQSTTRVVESQSNMDYQRIENAVYRGVLMAETELNTNRKGGFSGITVQQLTKDMIILMNDELRRVGVAPMYTPIPRAER